MKRHLAKVEGSDFDFDTEAMKMHGDKLDICLGDYDAECKINTEMAAYKWDNTIFMSEEEKKKLPEGKLMKKMEPPTMPDLSKSVRVYVNKDDLKVNEI